MVRQSLVVFVLSFVSPQNVEVTNFHKSWSDGMVFCALLHSYLPEKVEFDKLQASDRSQNLELAFSIAADVGIPRLLVR